MKKSSVFFQVIIVLIGIGALTFMLWEPHIEGRNAHSTLFEIYFQDPFLAYAYIASIPFFVVLYQAFRVLGYNRQEKSFPQAAVKALRIIRYCAISLIGLVIAGEIIIIMNNSDDRAGGVFMGILIALGSAGIAIAAAMSERMVHRTLNNKSPNNLTV